MSWHEIRCEPSAWWENGRPDVTIDAGLATEHHDLGTGARLVLTGSANEFLVEGVNTSSSSVSMNTRFNTGNGDVRFGIGDIARPNSVVTLRLRVPARGSNMRVEIVSPLQNAITAGGAPQGFYPTRILANAPMNVVAPTPQTHRAAGITDSIGIGEAARDGSVRGAISRLKRGLTIMHGAGAPAAWNNADNYAEGARCIRGRLIWEAKVANTNVDPSAATIATWGVYGFLGSFTLYRSHGFQRLFDLFKDAPTRAAMAAELKALVDPTLVVPWLGSNDVALAGGFTGLAQFKAAFGAGLDAIHAECPTAEIIPYTPLARGAVYPETTAFNGYDMPQARAAQVDEGGLRPAFVPMVVDNGTTIDATTDTVDLIHPNTPTHRTKLLDRFAYLR